MKTQKITELPRKMTYEEAWEYYKNQLSNSGFLYPNIELMNSNKNGVISSIRLEDYEDKLANLMLKMNNDLSKQGLLDWDKIAQTTKLLKLQGGMGYQLIGRNNPLFQ
jgi:hypothetical protein